MTFSGWMGPPSPIADLTAYDDVPAAPRRVPATLDSGNAWRAYEGGSPIADRHAALLNEERALTESLNRMRAQVRGVLGRFGTVDKLVAEWPEIAPFCPGPERAASLPAVPVAALNELLRLPPESVPADSEPAAAAD